MAKDNLRFLGDESGSVNCTCDILNKDLSNWNYVQYMLDRTNRMFRYSNLPDTIPAYMLEYMLQVFGSVSVLEWKGSLYALRAYFGGPPDPYYRPTIATIANPALNISDTFRVVNNLPPANKSSWENYPPCVRFLNDSQIQGLLPLFSRYASQMTENDISIRSAQINLRQQVVIVADTGPEIESANSYIKSLEEGRLSSIQKRAFNEGIKVERVSSTANQVFQLIELQQYLKASWYNEIGLNSNFNMKSQYLSRDELNSSTDIMLPLVDNMLWCRQKAIEEINSQFGTNITVEKDSAWEDRQILQDPLSTSSLVISNMTSNNEVVPGKISITDTETKSDEELKDQELSDSQTETIDDAIEVALEAIGEIVDIVNEEFVQSEEEPKQLNEEQESWMMRRMMKRE